jgi:hypothetical protein
MTINQQGTLKTSTDVYLAGSGNQNCKTPSRAHRLTPRTEMPIIPDELLIQIPVSINAITSVITPILRRHGLK